MILSTVFGIFLLFAFRQTVFASMQASIIFLLLITYVACVPLTTTDVDSQSLYVIISISGVGDERLNVIKQTLSSKDNTKWVTSLILFCLQPD